MRVAIITSVSTESCEELQEHFKANKIKSTIFHPLRDDPDQLNRTFADFDWVFAYGCSAKTFHPNRINTRKATIACIDKTKAFAAFNKAGVSTVRWWAAENIHELPKDVETLVVRKDRKGRKAEDLTYWYRVEGKPLVGDLFTEYFEHKWEYRVTVFKDQIWVYWKQFNPADGMHTFVLQRSSKYPKMIDHCKRAAKELGIDYCSFDVVAQSRDEFAILEANSGTILTEEVSTAIVEFFLNL